MTNSNRARTSNRSDEAAHAAAYAGVRERVTALVRMAPEGALDAIAPATPDWRTRDVLAHLVGVATDVVNGNVADAAQDHWTAAQVEARCELPVDALLEEWAATAPQIEAIVLSLATSITGQLIIDAATHEHDLRHALGQPGARESDALTLGLAWYLFQLEETPNYWIDFFPGSAITGIGVSMIFPMLSAAAVHDADLPRLSLASGAARTANQLGSATGIALLFSALGDSPNALSHFRDGWRLLLVMTALAGLISAGLAPHRARSRVEASP